MSRIFVAEDDVFIGRVYERAFRLAHHEITIESDGEAAWKTLASSSEQLPEVIILDLKLPTLGGKELLKLIKNDSRFEKIPVVVLTNAFDLELEKELTAMGASLFLIKIDTEPALLISKIEELISKSK